MRIKPGGAPPPTITQPTEAPAATKPLAPTGAESHTGWQASFKAVRDAFGLGLGELVRAAGITQALSALKEAVLPPHERAEAITLLVSHVDALSVGQRAELLTEIQKTGLGPTGAAAATAVLLGTHGKDLTQLKNLVEAGGDLFNLQSLVFDTLNTTQRAQVLAHFAAEAVPTGEVKLLSDIDDTVYASLNDPRFQKGALYPGVHAFFAALDEGPRAAAKGDVLFLTARSRLEADVTFDTLARLGFDVPTVMTGSLATYLRRILEPLGKGDWAYRAMGARKVDNFQRHEQLFPEYAYVFCGDNGQGDVHAGLGMLKQKPERMHGIFIHVVKERSAEGDEGIGYFHTYVGAAAQALKAGLISKEQAAGVAHAALGALETTAFRSDEGKQRFTAQLTADLKALDALLA